MIASDVMASPVYVVSPSETVARARNLMLKHHISRVLVMEGDRLTGILTKKDIGYRLRQCEPIWRRRPVDRIPVILLATPDPVCVGPETGIKEIAEEMIEYQISGVPVVDKEKVVGIVTKSDLLRSELVNHIDSRVADMMEDAITVSRYHSLDHIIDLMCERDDKVVVVNNDGTLAGIITESNLAFYTYENDRTGDMPEKDVKMLRKDSEGRKIYRYVADRVAIAEDLMSRPVVTVVPDAPISDGVRLMREEKVNSLVVVEGNEIKGILKRDDIIREVAK